MAAKNKFMNAMKMPAIADMFSSEADRQRESGDLVTEVPLSELHPFVNHPFEVRDDEDNLGLRGAANHSAESAFKGRSAKIAPRGTRFTSTSRQLVQLCLTNFLQQITCRIGFGTHGCITINTHIIHLIYFE